MGLTVVQAGPLEGNMHRREVILEGNAHDINRLVEAGKKKMQQIEQSKQPLDAMTKLHVDAPQDDEP